MIIILLIEVLLTCMLAAAAGFLLGRLKGLFIVGGVTLFFDVLTLCIAALCYRADYFPTIQLDVILDIAIWTYAMAGVLGYFLTDKKDAWLTDVLGAAVMEIFTFGAAMVCFLFSALPSIDIHNNLPGGSFKGILVLVFAIVLIGLLVPTFFARTVLKGKGASAIRFMWFGFCILCWVGNWAAGRLGLLLITLPLILTFWGFLYHLSQLILPMEQNQGVQAFRSLLTFTLGTNYPYYVIDDWKSKKKHKQDKPTPKVPGDPFLQFFAGPGIVLNDCNHLAVISDGMKFWIAPPGLSFTRQFEQLYTDIDLRPQLRTTTIKAETKDGISVSIFTFIPHRMDTGGTQPALGTPYPFVQKSVLQAVWEQAFIDHTWRRDSKSNDATEEIKKIPWDELVLMMGPPILKGLVSNYTCNGLHAPGDPRVEIASSFRAQIKAAMAPLGIEVIGGGISDIVAPSDVIDQRVKNWEAAWKHKIEIEVGEAEAEITRQLEPVSAEAELEIMNELTEILARAGQVTEETLMFQLIATLSEPDQQITEGDPTTKRLLMRRAR